MKSIITLLLLFTATLSFAQNHWMYLPNNGFDKGSKPGDTTYRIEDIYFADTFTGHAVTLTGRILKTTDGGINWKIKNDTLAAQPYLRSIEFLSDKIYGLAGCLGANAQLLRTTDGGETWTDIASNVNDTTVSSSSAKNICGLAHFGNTFYGVGSWGSKVAKFYRSDDKGSTWQTKYLDTSMVKNLIDVVFLSQDTGFVVGSRGKESIVLKTTDGGNSWIKVFGDTTLGGRVWKLQFLTKQIAFGAIEPLFHPDTVAMIRSLDGGASWTMMPAGSIHHSSGSPGNQGVGFVTPAKGWLGGYYDGVFETVDSGKTWNHISFGYDFNRMFVIDSNHVFAGGHMPYKYGNGIPVPSAINNSGKSTLPHVLHPVSPNPAKGSVKIEFDLKNATNVVLDVVNTDGRIIYSIENTFLKAGHYTYSWNGTDAPAGNYIVWLGTNEIPIVQKFVLHK